MNTVTAPLPVIDMIEAAPAPALPVATMPQGLSNVAVTPSDLLQIAMQSQEKDIALLERLMSMDERYREQQERERQRAAVLAFRRDFAAFRGENIVIPKTKFVDRAKAGSFYQAEYDQVMGRISPALSKHGFGIRHDQKFGLKAIEGVEGAAPWVWVTCYLEHRDGHVEMLALEGPPGDQPANSPVQNMQVTASYLKRQSTLAITGTPTGGEDDESAMRNQKNAAATESADEGLIEAGEAASTNGAKALVAWWGALTQKQRDQLSPQFLAWKRAAAKFDQDQAQKGKP